MLDRPINTSVGALPRALQRFIALESAGGIIMIAATVAALIAANSQIADAYKALVAAPVTVGFGTTVIAHPLKLVIKDVLMVLFFLAVGMELKREMVMGVLRDRDQVLLPLIAALGGMVMPSLVYLAIAGGADTARGWAIPSATDIAFALAILQIFGGSLDPSLKVLLLAIAIFDDLGAILIIALFYSSGVAFWPLMLAGAVIGLLALANHLQVGSLVVYGVLGIALAVLFGQGGVHATLAGVVTGLSIPLVSTERGEHSPLDKAMHLAHPWVTYLVLPVFAFVSAGVSLHGLSLGQLLEPLPLAIMAGLFIGKQIGIFGTVWLASRSGLARLPRGAELADIYAVSVLAGIGFTMSLFIGLLAFPDVLRQEQVRLGVLAGSLLSTVWGGAVLMFVARRR